MSEAKLLTPEELRLYREGFAFDSDRDCDAARGLLGHIAALEVRLEAAEFAAEWARDRFKHIAADTSPEGYGGGHERVCYNATQGQQEMEALLVTLASIAALKATS